MQSPVWRGSSVLAQGWSSSDNSGFGRLVQVFRGGGQKPVCRYSSLAWLHVGRYSSSSSQAFEAFVGVVDEDPVLVLQVGLSLVRHRGGLWRRRDRKSWGHLKIRRQRPEYLKCVRHTQAAYLLVWGYLNQGIHQSLMCRQCFWSLWGWQQVSLWATDQWSQRQVRVGQVDKVWFAFENIVTGWHSADQHHYSDRSTAFIIWSLVSFWSRHHWWQ